MCGCGCELAASRELLMTSAGASSAGETGMRTPLDEEWQGWWGELIALMHDLAPNCTLFRPMSAPPTGAPILGSAQ